MTPLLLHVPGRRGLVRWTLSAAAIVAAHGALIGTLVYWYTRTPPEEKIIPAIAVSIVPAAPVTQVEDDMPVAAQETPKIDPTPEQPKVEVKAEPPPEEIKPPPPPPLPAEVVLPKPEPVEKKPVEKKPIEKKLAEKKPVEKKPPIEYRPAQEARERAASREALHQSSVAASNAYNSLVYGHLQQYKSYPASANGASGHPVAHFVLSRTGNVLSASIVQSSGNAALDAAALASVRNANPFPPFPAEKTGAQDGFTAPFKF